MAMALHTPADHLTFNWQTKSNSHQRIARFVDYLFSRIDRLQAPGFDPKWKSINPLRLFPDFPASLQRRKGRMSGGSATSLDHQPAQF